MLGRVRGVSRGVATGRNGLIGLAPGRGLGLVLVLERVLGGVGLLGLHAVKLARSLKAT